MCFISGMRLRGAPHPDQWLEVHTGVALSGMAAVADRPGRGCIVWVLGIPGLGAQPAAMPQHGPHLNHRLAGLESLDGRPLLVRVSFGVRH
jgi:hypothetical protein